ncbi:MAG: class II aldolase/adducin family protein, partial [Cyanobacteria bacterium]|nr:class II aldolase/adducin family protein [Cyanobacteriota bacterium]
MVKTPKLIGSMRQWFGRAFLVGFKLLSGVDPKQRHQIALAQIHKNRTNLCVENDLTEVSSKSHKARLVTPEGGAIPIPVGSKTDVAKSVLDFIEKREDVRWFQTIFSEKIPAQLPPTGKALASQLLKVAQSSGLLVDASGNLSVKRPKGFMIISPRGGNKALLQPEQMMLVRVNQKNRKIYTSLSRAIAPPTLTGLTGGAALNPLKPQKPSIDTGVSDALYKKFPKLQALLHTHSIWGVGAAKTQFPYPCGVQEEAQQIIQAKNQQDPTGEKPFLVQLVNHGLLLGLASPLTVEKLAQQWEAVQKDFDVHMAEVGATKEELTGGTIQGILSPEGFVGSVYTHQNGSV